MKEKVGIVKEQKPSFVTLFKMLWNPEPIEDSLDDVLKDSDLNEKDIEELKKSQNDIAKMENNLKIEAIEKKRKKNFEYKTNTSNIKATEQKQKTNLNEIEKERE